MKYRYLVLVLAFAAVQAMATQKPDHCKPEPKPRDPPAVSKPEPRAPQSRSEGQRDTATLCSRWPTLVGCPHTSK